jgi:uncharacterized protein DUF6484
MHVNVTDTAEMDLASSLTGGNLRSGHIVGVTSSGEALVDYPGNSGGPLQARSVVALDLAEVSDPEPLPVLLFFERPGFGSPIILGVIHSTIHAPRPREASDLRAPGPTREILVDGKTFQVDADQEIVLRCGASSLSLKRNGKIVLKGVEIISRASEANKIRGAIVRIN